MLLPESLGEKLGLFMQPDYTLQPHLRAIGLDGVESANGGVVYANGNAF